MKNSYYLNLNIIFAITFTNTGFNVERFWTVVPGFGYSSFDTVTVSLLLVNVTGTISLSKYPFFIAVSALCWDWAAYWSCSSLLILYSLATFSAMK